MSERMPYCIPHRRELSPEELSLLRFLLEKEAPNRLLEINLLKVVARCGCGQCPTVLFGLSLDQEPDTSQSFTAVADYMGRNSDNVLVGVMLIDRNGRLSELEAWSPEGEDIKSWPPLSELKSYGGGRH